eukprot:TRINITY_DN1300_c0_g1_i6.p1 TRINITY_DN1300_c0_g1~~TRINITY_DN1300_c0_g1_i6.p1  ORF type:complete len:508 (+),score=131.73 TRINITY_DN1300_c0_g1_i6:45-1568(+)
MLLSNRVGVSNQVKLGSSTQLAKYVVKNTAKTVRARRTLLTIKNAATETAITASTVKQLRDMTGAGMMDCKKALSECNGDVDEAKDYLRKKGLAKAAKKAGRVAAEGRIQSYVHMGSRLGVLLEINCETDFVSRGNDFKELAQDISMQIAACPEVVCVSMDEVPADLIEKERKIEMGKEDIQKKPENVRGKIVEGRLEKMKKSMALLEQPFVKDSSMTVEELIKEGICNCGENIQVRRFTRFVLGEGIENKTKDFAEEVAEQTKAKEADPKPKQPEKPKTDAKAEDKPKVAVDPKLVKQLRDQIGAGMMDCKKALAECNNDINAATEFLRKKGLAKADKKSGRVAAEGAIGSYIHQGSRLGVLIEVNCETDFAAKGDIFKELVSDMAMQVAACPTVQFVSADDVSPEVLESERAAEMQKEDIQNKPENLRGKIVEGRVMKIVKEMALLDQPYIRDSTKTVEEVVKEAIAACGENIKIRRFERFNLGEGIEKKESDFAAEVAAATGSI